MGPNRWVVEHEPNCGDGAPGRDHEATFERVYAQQFDYVWRTLRRLGVRERDLEDKAHDVFVVVYRALDRYDPDRPIKPWLFGISFRVVSDYRRKAGFSRELPVETAGEAPDTGPDAFEHVARAEQRALVSEALEALPDDQRAVFVMVELEGLAVPEIAATLAIPDNTAYSRLRLARRRFTAAVRRLVARAPPGAT